MIKNPRFSFSIGWDTKKYWYRLWVEDTEKIGWHREANWRFVRLRGDRNAKQRDLHYYFRWFRLIKKEINPNVGSFIIGPVKKHVQTS